jgi:hypothetical protein
MGMVKSPHLLLAICTNFPDTPDLPLSISKTTILKL